MEQFDVKIEFLHEDAWYPARATHWAAGYDLSAYLKGRTVTVFTTEFAGDRPYNTVKEVPYEAEKGIRFLLQPGERALIPTGIKIMVPEGYFFDVRGRSGIGIKYGVTLAQGIGTVDPDYADELMVPLINHNKVPFRIDHGDRIAQLVWGKQLVPEWYVGKVLPVSDRQGGFGSTGI
jgi:dUTP pyrophosphatase